MFTTASNWQGAYRKRPSETNYVIGEPQEGDDVYIPCEWRMVFNKAYFKFGTLVIDGVFTIDETLTSVVIEANNIWVKMGEFNVGSESQRYQNNLEIILTGTKNS